MFACFRVVVDLDLLDLAKSFTHVLQEALVNIVIKVCEGHFLVWDLANIIAINLEVKRQIKLCNI